MASVSPGPVCSGPIHSYITDVSKVECIAQCLLVRGCSSFNFRPVSGRTGDCVVIGPHTDALSIAIPGEADNSWFYYGLNE